MSFWKRLKYRLGVIEFTEREFALNQPGLPKDNITWQEAWEKRSNHYFMQEPYLYLLFVPPKVCQKCGSPVSCKYSDYQTIENKSIPFVHTYYCENGCGYYSEAI